MAPLQLPGGFGGLMMAFNQPGRALPGMAVPDVSSTPMSTTVFITPAATISPPSSPVPPPPWLHDGSVAQDSTGFTFVQAYWRQFLAELSSWDLLLFAYCVLCAFIALEAADRLMGPETGRRFDLRRGWKRFAWTIFLYISLLLTLPLITAHLVLQFFAWVCLDILLLTVRQKQRHGLLPLFYKSGDHHHHRRHHRNQETQHGPNHDCCDCSTDCIINSNSAIDSPCPAIRVLKKYVELPPLRLFMDCMRYGTPLRVPSCTAPNGYIWYGTTADSRPATAQSFRQQRQARNQEQQARSQPSRKAHKKIYMKIRRGDSDLPPGDGPAECRPLMS
ncbi:hypothetical protein PG996_009979 [Apiospora saccharicola]|uniref:Uncharacterized protein n=1 Tax=Apiospora saccharicola TaxID=335842 RepID=A0ABR1UQC4_9PEZI